MLTGHLSRCHRYQPNITRLPNNEHHGKTEGRKRYVALGTTKYHTLFTQFQDCIIGTRHLGYPVLGDVVILMLSDTKDEKGLGFLCGHGGQIKA